MAEPKSGVLVALEAMVSPGKLSEDALQIIATGQQALVTEWVRELYPEMKSNPNAARTIEGFSQRVAASDRSLDEWLVQVLKVYRWLQQQGRYAHFSDICEYSSCAWLGDSEQGVEHYLARCGFERSIVRKHPADS